MPRLLPHRLWRQSSLLLQKTFIPSTSSRCEMQKHSEATLINCKSGSKHPESLSWLGSVAPRFALDGKQVSVISSPTEFYDQLLQRSQSAVRRITLASLYIGTGTLEKNLVSSLSTNLKHSNGNLKVCVLLDFARSSRGKFNSRSLLLPLLSDYQQNCQVSLYHTPSLRGVLKRLLPQRWNEIIGLQHMKIYLFDDNVIISGANLSNDYFTNRQDRYMVIEDCKELADFLDGLVQKVSEFSFQLTPENNLQLNTAWKDKEHPYLGDRDKFVRAARQHVWNYYSAQMKNNATISEVQSATPDTWLYPFIEMGQLGLQNDSIATKKLIETAPEGASLALSTGYFNLTNQYSQSIINSSKATFNILMAHPKANGFLGAKGPAGGIPAAYTLLAHRFLNLLRSRGQENRISLWEYQRSGWTYHAKGMWYTMPGEPSPALTLIGSPNFGQRSVNRDLELQAALVSDNQELRKRLGGELAELSARTTPFSIDTIGSKERTPPLWVRLVVAFFKNFF